MCRIACSVCDRITQSNDASSKPASPRFEVALEHVDAVARRSRARRRRRSRCRSRSRRAARARYASRLPSPQPRSSTRAPGAIQPRDRREVGARASPHVDARGDCVARFRRRRRRRARRARSTSRRCARNTRAPRAWYCGLSSRNASWPCGASISAYDTSRRLSTSAFTISRERAGGKRQSVVNATTRNRQRRRRERAREVAAGAPAPGRSSRAPW